VVVAAITASAALGLASKGVATVGEISSGLRAGLGVVDRVGVDPARGPVGLRSLAAGGLLAAVGFAVLRRLSAFYLPTLITSNQQQFGLLGVAFTLFSWLTACAFIIVVATSSVRSWPRIPVGSASSSGLEALR
jgi:hypothetical protein